MSYISAVPRLPFMWPANFKQFKNVFLVESKNEKKCLVITHLVVKNPFFIVVDTSSGAFTTSRMYIISLQHPAL